MNNQKKVNLTRCVCKLQVPTSGNGLAIVNSESDFRNRQAAAVFTKLQVTSYKL